jgi:hypothetical protein
MNDLTGRMAKAIDDDDLNEGRWGPLLEELRGKEMTWQIWEDHNIQTHSTRTLEVLRGALASLDTALQHALEELEAVRRVEGDAQRELQRTKAENRRLVLERAAATEVLNTVDDILASPPMEARDMLDRLLAAVKQRALTWQPERTRAGLKKPGE